MNTDYVEFCGFRGFRKKLRIDFSDTFTVIDGRNGAGKSTIFDAIEFALSGTISKYLDATSSGESIDNYIWWCGEPRVSMQQYVEIGFSDDDVVHSVRRTPFDSNDVDVSQVLPMLMNLEIPPSVAIKQLCNTCIIRDEHIARLSLDLKDTDRFTLLRDSIGALDANHWIEKAARLVSATNDRRKRATTGLDRANDDLRNAVAQHDRAQAQVTEGPVLMDAIAGLQELLSSTSGPVEIADQARRRIADIRTKQEEFQSLLYDWTEMERLYAHVAELDALVDTAQVAFDEATRDLEELFERIGPRLVATELSYDARKLESLIYIGRALGLRNGHCPLCDSNIDDEQFEHGLRTGLAMAQDLDGQAVELAERERAQVSAVDRVGATKSALDTAMEERQAVLLRIDRFNQRLEATGLSDVSVMSLSDMIDDLSREHGDIAKNLRLLDTMSYNQMLENVAAEMKIAKMGVERAETRLGRSKLAESRARSVHHTVRRAAAETLDQRLNRVLPLMA